MRTCDCFNIPIVMLVDVPGFLPGTDQNTTASSGAAPSCSTPTARPPCQRSRSSPARPTAVRTALWAQRHGLRRQPGVADRADRGDGRLRRSGASCTASGWPRPPPTARTSTSCGAAPAGVRGHTGQPVRGRRTRIRRRGDPAVAYSRLYIGTALRLLERKIAQLPPKSMNVPL
ncbi:carboxyl transferase domain-containing protein [Mycobacterium tuberculosis]